MATELYMPKNGLDMKEGTIVKWLKNIGDKIEKDEPFMEIETDKITMEVESPAAGVLLKKLYEDGAVVPVLTAVGYIGKGETTFLTDSTIFTADQINAIKKIERIEKLLSIMEKHLNGELKARDLIKYVPEWRKDIAELTEMISNLYGE